MVSRCRLVFSFFLSVSFRISGNKKHKQIDNEIGRQEPKIKQTPTDQPERTIECADAKCASAHELRRNSMDIYNKCECTIVLKWES